MALLSIVVPCYNEEPMLPLFYETVEKTRALLREKYGLETEYIFVDDGSRDGTLAIMKQLHAKDEAVHYVSFSRNFGKEAGIYAGLQKAKGEYVAMMDADLQDPPELLGEMYEGLAGGEYDCVATRRTTRKGEPPIRSFFARAFYKLINRISQVQMVDGARDYRLMTRQMVNSILEMTEYNRFSKGIFAWVGYKTKWLEYQNIERAAGETKWSFWKLFLYSIEGIISFSTAPLSISSAFGFVFFVLAVIMMVFYAIKALAFGDPVAGFPTLVCLILLIGGIQLFCTGVLGQYLSKTYLEVKNRPVYIVKEEDGQKG